MLNSGHPKRERERGSHEPQSENQVLIALNETLARYHEKEEGSETAGWKT